MTRNITINVRVDSEDRALLDAAAAAEKLPRSEIIRRAVRQYAERLGVEAPKPKRRAR